MQIMPVIDTYTIFGSWPSGGADLSMGRLKRALDGRDVVKAIAHTTDSVFETSKQTLDDLKAKTTAESLLVPAAVINPAWILKPWELAADVAEQGFACVRFFPDLHKWPIGDYAPFERCLEALEPSGIPVSVTITEPGQITQLSRIDAARRIPMILVHLAASCASEVTTVVPSLEKWAVSTDGMVHTGLLDELADAIGGERLIFGSTAPRGSIEGSLRTIKYSSLSDNVKEMILSKNAERIFGGRIAIN